MCRLRIIALSDYQESVTTRQTDRHRDREECMCRLRIIAMCDYQESVTTVTRKTDRWMDRQMRTK